LALSNQREKLFKGCCKEMNVQIEKYGTDEFVLILSEKKEVLNE
jgi:hypothetical protein